MPATLQQKCRHFNSSKYKPYGHMDIPSETSTELLYQAPASMYVLFWMAGIAFAVSTIRWLIHARYAPTPPTTEFKPHIWRDQILNIFFVCVLSVIIGIYDHYHYNLPINIIGECVTLILGTALVAFLSKTDTIKAIAQFYKRFLSFGILCLTGWGITAAIAYSLYYALQATIPMSNDNRLIASFMITGILWCTAPILIYQKIMKNSELRPRLSGYKAHNFLWPILLTYLALLFPLMMQEIANSENWRKMTNKKPLRSAQVDIFPQQDIFPFI